ncbi:heterocycloanthracin/sonorensin family bacteriocin [Bacillus pseudomycoides]|uniref:heterocycloanthracin/sonorensin family bacteriocin n=1 Tax=Bacillus pseudomycoides TaxID=64104 RepID=UPI0023DA66F6|nr:heterocycloanthracin/sonorensin family bacteriocin [Bacillus pseudomycoides]MDF2085449.1 heterocycloanthracin/sonorensin family bacteriocin [Bacillus pseudomycoides]
MNEFQQELQALSLNDYQSGNVVYWDQQNQYPYYYIEDDARRCGGCGRCGGFRCGGFRCFGCGGCGGCGGCSNCFDGFNGATWWVI